MTKIEENTEITLGLLNAVNGSSSVTQRAVAQELGVALGLVNTYLKRCVKKGLIKVRQVPANRYAYYLTPKGFSEKARLTGEYLSQGFQLFRVSRFQLSQIIGDCEEKGFKKVVLSGLSDIAEIAILCAQDFGIEIVAIYEEASEKTEYGNIRIVSKISEIPKFDAVIVTEISDSSKRPNSLLLSCDPKRLFVPDILGVPMIHDKRV